MYMLHEEKTSELTINLCRGGEGRVFYKPEEADDFDEDLNNDLDG